RKLHEQRAQALRLPQRLDAALEAIPQRVQDVLGQVPRFELAALQQRRLEAIAQRTRQTQQVDQVPRHRSVCLDVELEALRRPLNPARYQLGLQQRVVGRVDFHQVEVSRVVAQTCLGLAGATRVESMTLKQRWVRPTR